MFLRIMKRHLILIVMLVCTLSASGQIGQAARLISPQTTLTFQARGAVIFGQQERLSNYQLHLGLGKKWFRFGPTYSMMALRPSLVIQGNPVPVSEWTNHAVGLEAGVNVLNLKSLKVTPTVMIGCMLTSYRNASSLKERQNAFYLYPKVEAIYYPIPFVGIGMYSGFTWNSSGSMTLNDQLKGADLGVVLSFKTR